MLILSKCLDDTKLWDSNRTITLLQLIKEHEDDFKLHSSRQRIEIWDEIAEEMQKYGYIDATKLSCSKKWYNCKKKYFQVTGVKSKEKKWYCYNQVKYLIPVMKRLRQLPFIHHFPSPSTSSKHNHTTNTWFPFMKTLMETMSTHNQKVLETIESFRIEKEKLNQEQNMYLEEIQKSLQERSERIQGLDSDSELNTVIMSSSSTAVVRTSSNDTEEILNLLPMDNCTEMVELVDGENIIQTTSTTGESIQLTICVDWNQVSH